MEEIFKSVPFLAENWALIGVILGALLAVATVIVRKTATKADDKVLDALLEIKDALGPKPVNKDK